MNIDGILTPEQEATGLILFDEGEGDRSLWYGELRIGFFLPEAQPEHIRAAADIYLARRVNV